MSVQQATDAIRDAAYERPLLEMIAASSHRSAALRWRSVHEMATMAQTAIVQLAGMVEDEVPAVRASARHTLKQLRGMFK